MVLEEYWDWSKLPSGSDAPIHALPMFHAHGLFVAIHGALISGSKNDLDGQVRLQGRASIYATRNRSSWAFQRTILRVLL